LELKKLSNRVASLLNRAVDASDESKQSDSSDEDVPLPYFR